MKKYDVLIGMSQNIRLGNSKKEIENSPTHLSYLSQEVAIVTATLFSQDLSKYILFTGGFTTKFSEAQWMKNFVLSKFSNIKSEQIIIEENSFDTSTSVKATVNLIKHMKFKKVGVVAPSMHERRTLYYFKRYGMEIAKSDFYKSGEIVSQISPELKERSQREYNSFLIVLERFIKEPYLNFELLFDPDGKIPRFITSRSRG